MPSRRAKAPALYELALERPEPGLGLGWQVVGTYTDLEVAVDEARSPLRPHDEGVVVRVTGPRPGRLAWLGVATAEGCVVEMGRRPADGREDWVSLWEGPRADAYVMLSETLEVDPRALVLALCDLARAAVKGLALPDLRPHLRALEVARAWAEGDPEAEGLLLGTFLAADRARQEAIGEGERVERALEAVSASVYAAQVAAAAPDDPYMDLYNTARSVALAASLSLGSGRSPGSAAARDRALRQLAPLVRAHLSLGMALLGRLAHGRALAQMRAES